MKNEKEIWRTYPDYSFIEVSNLGRIRTKDRVVTRSNGTKYHAKGRVLKQWISDHGYMYVTFSVNGKNVNLRVHRMVAITFIPNPHNYSEVNHIDCDRTNNRLDNLEWCTRQENVAYRDKLGHTAKHNAPKKQVIAINPDTFEIFWFESQSEAAHQLDIDVRRVNKVIKGKQQQAGDYWFCYADETAVEKTRAKFGDKIAEKVEELIRDHL